MGQIPLGDQKSLFNPFEQQLQLMQNVLFKADYIYFKVISHVPAVIYPQSRKGTKIWRYFK